MSYTNKTGDTVILPQRHWRFRCPAHVSFRVSAFLISCLAILGPVAAIASEDRWIPQAQIERVVHDLLGAVAQSNYEQLVRGVDARTRRHFDSLIDAEFEGDSAKFMRMLYLVRHPSRFRTRLKIPDIDERGECTNALIDLTGNYSTFEDKNIPPPIANKPVRMWVCFVREGSEVRIRMDYGVHDLIYLLQ